MSETKANFSVRAVLGLLIFTFLNPLALFLTAGTTDWPEGRVYTVILVLSLFGSRLITYFKFPDLLKERGQFIQHTDVPHWDRGLVNFAGLFGPLLIVIIAGLDYRWQWSPVLPQALKWPAGLLVAAGYGLSVWAMVSNRFFSSIVRIQKERAHHVVRSGPYRWIRHPGYAGYVYASIALPFLFGTLWAMLPVLVSNSILVLRTYLEDGYLVDHLVGYREYTLETRYRLFPGIW